MSEWISVEDKLPEEWGRVLICDVNDDIDEYIKQALQKQHLLLVEKVVVNQDLSLKV